jgi:transcriptional regulator
MYCPAPFARADAEELLAFIAAHPFATLIGQVDGRPCASSVPLIAARRAGAIELIGHVARGNPLARATAALAVFHGPHAYISAAWYGTPAMVPTWNYQEVQAEGVVEVIADADGQRAALAALAAHLEGAAARAWQERLDEAAADRLRAMIVFFRVRVASLHGTWKLSQNRTPELHARVVASLRARAAGDDLAVAAAMVAAGVRAPPR